MKSEKISVSEACEYFKAHDNFIIISQFGSYIVILRFRATYK